MEEMKKDKFFKSPEGLLFGTAWLIFGVGGLLFVLFGFQKWDHLLKMLIAGQFVGKGASIPIGVHLLNSRLLTALIVFLQDIVSLFIIFPLVLLLKKKVLKSKVIEDTFNQVEDFTKEHKWIKTFGIVGVAFCALFPFQPITGPITASIIGIIVGLPVRLNLTTVIASTAASVGMWTFFYGQVRDLTANLNQNLVTAITIITMLVLYVIFYFLIFRRKRREEISGKH
ncbi:hypothetical protein COY52_07250 [Candidatus Desantisbacteria bacterium CG_4_10_14_0_8_um_filter_48_22]|uniref:Small multi-drug export protein n=1 Tax=Candidatus Desantisbacteria bacterium CG_4_10_14_0_8_um_filter_48_22 TaxID=1974543 RepID=A0A2M7S9X5_9BACT|nr:MAG: hypothetical protein AUJ67_07305 [Candidatus Desantisbacteria bacterium CG1_02_49_89]PIV54220.1 MAG: hypothetical protein COS16_11415 [Candidatus Desantisbacteria bacterium CG02_land_8_20_14_3_00_49_13]PIZ16337.1 MAG: hypothetical protein COY52_07250 [Candidatus Desantisbacteria bacterium CG_4_10_14_0_8_um_filter_48_22]PJB27155.1 MAG: hypothetical protein CO111_06825 [Candidatus Desantisbacteria bacterium CG_4_9_14_3_um_filter_50_7]